MSFRLTTVLWAFALLAAALATFGPWGIFAALAVILLWARRFSIILWCLVLLVAIALFLPAIQSAREASRRNSCMNNFRQVSLALENYEANRGALPPAAGSAHPQGPPRSWRLLILPNLEHQKLYGVYRHDEPWDSPNNLVVGQASIDVLACPSNSAADAADPETTYFAVVGPHAAFLPNRGRAWSEFKDARSQTILVIEAAERKTPWLKPEDLSFDEAVTLLTAPRDDDAVHFALANGGLFHRDNQGPLVNVLFADGRVGAISLPISKELATALLTIDGGETIDERELSRAIERQLDYGKCYAFAMFVALSVAPALRWFRIPSLKTQLAE